MSRRARSSRRQLAELSFLLRAVMDELASQHRGPKGRAHRAALDLVDAFVRGELATPEMIESSRAHLAEGQRRLWVHSSPLWRALYHLPVDALLRVVERGADETADVLERLEEAASFARRGDASIDVDALRARAREHAAAIDATPFDAPSAEASAEETALLARSHSALSGAAPELLALAGAARDASQTTDRETLSTQLRELGLPVSEPLLAFEEDFGGLLLPITTHDGWRDDGGYAVIGPWAMLTSHSLLPRGDATGDALVLVARGWQEDFYYLDARGAPYRHWTINEADPVPYGATSAELLTRLVIGALTFQADEPRGALVYPNAARVPAAAAELGLTRLFGDERSEWWVGPAALVVVLDGEVYALARTERALATLQR